MSHASFSKLLAIIKEDDLIVNDAMASLRGDAIIPELCLYCTILWLVGGSYTDIFYYCGISETTFYRIVRKTINCLCFSQDLALKITFPKTESDKCLTAAEGFHSISTNGCISN
jgi:hypothetical protein